LLALASCGGGGGGGGTGGADDTPFPTLSEDINPSGARVEVAGRDFFALTEGGAWGYERTSDGLPPIRHSRYAIVDAESKIVLRDEMDGTRGPDEFRYQYEEEGLVSVNPLGSAASEYPAVAAALPSLLEFATPFYPAGATRRVVRQGDLAKDLDGDGRNERFRVEFTQVFLGFQSMQVMDVTREVAGFRNTFSLTIYTTRDRREAKSLSTEESYWADGVGMVRASRSATASNGAPVFTAYTMQLTDAVVGGIKLTPGWMSSTPIPLPRRDLVYDADRSVYYATVGADDSTNRNRLAVIDANSGVTSFSREIGTAPGTVAIAGDSSVLYVGLQGSGEVVKLALPSMAELARFRLPIEPFRRTQYLPEDIAVSSAEPDLIAVSMYLPVTRLTRHAGILVARGMVPLPKRTSASGDGNLLAFSPDGTTLHSSNNESQGTVVPIRQFGIGVDGPTLKGRLDSLGIGYPYDYPELNIVDDLMTIQGSVWTAGSTPVNLGWVSGLHCSKLHGVSKIACLGKTWNTLAVYSLPSLELLGTVEYATSGNSLSWRLVPGPAGQVAIVNNGQIQLFSDPLLH
jgi:hypothetical protein